MIGPSLALPEGEGSKNALSLLSPPLGELEEAYLLPFIVSPNFPNEGLLNETSA